MPNTRLQRTRDAYKPPTDHVGKVDKDHAARASQGSTRKGVTFQRDPKGVSINPKKSP